MTISISKLIIFIFSITRKARSESSALFYVVQTAIVGANAHIRPLDLTVGKYYTYVYIDSRGNTVAKYSYDAWGKT